MKLVSYAQNFEDLMLWRALGHIEKGLYVDVGAQHPSFDSVSRCFYDNGWRGVHLEPTPTYAELLRNARPDETVLQVAAGAAAGFTQIFEIPGTGLSTGRPDIATHHAANGHEARELQVPCTTLAAIFDSIGERPIHWLKIDVEGMEREVLEGWGDHPARPWILVIESTFPGTRRRTETEWLDLVIARDYREVWFDGLSKFFVAEGHDDVAAAFDLPPNVFDGFAITLDHLMASALHHEGQLKDERHAQVTTELTALAEAAQHSEQTARVEFQRIVGDLSSAERGAAELHERASKLAAELQADLAHIRGELAQRTDEFCSLQRAALEREQALADQISTLTAAAQNQAAQLEQERAATAGMTAELHIIRRELDARNEDLRVLTQVANDREQGQMAHITQLTGELAQRTDEFYLLQRAALEREQALADQISTLTAAAQNQAAQLEQERAATAGMTAELHIIRRELDARNEDLRVLTQVANDREQGQMAHITQLTGEIASQNARLDHERQTSSDLAERLATLRQALSGSLERLRLPFAKMQATLLGTSAGLDEEDMAAIALSGSISLDGAARSIADLLRLHDDMFIQQAYRILLGREPDPTGHASYLDALRAGAPKEQIIASLARSSEGRQYGSMLPGLAKLLRTVPKRTGYFARKADARSAFARRFENALGWEIDQLARLIE